MKSVKARDGVYKLEFTRCNKERCKKCKEGKGHGPYWYRYWWEGGKTRKKYVGKELPPHICPDNLTEDSVEDVAPPRTSQKVDAQLCPECGQPLGDDLSQLEGRDGKICHKACMIVEE